MTEDILKTYPPDEYGWIEVHELVKRSISQLLASWPKPPAKKGMPFLLEQRLRALSAPGAVGELLRSDAWREHLDEWKRQVSAPKEMEPPRASIERA